MNKPAPWKDYFEAVTLGCFGNLLPASSSLLRFAHKTQKNRRSGDFYLTNCERKPDNRGFSGFSNGKNQKNLQVQQASKETPERFTALIRGIKSSWLVLHFFLLSIALNFPVMFAVSRLKPYALYSRLYGGSLVLPGSGSIEDFNILMYQNAYGRKIVLPVLAMAFVLVLILQLVFYVLAALGLGLQRLSLSYLSFRERLGLLLFSSTGAAGLAALFGLWLPTVHILVFYLAVIVIGFRRSRLCPNG